MEETQMPEKLEIHGFAPLEEPPVDPWMLMDHINAWYASCVEREETDVGDALEMIGELMRTLKDILVRPKFVQATYGGGYEEKAELFAIDERGGVWQYQWNDATYGKGTPKEWTRSKGWHPLCVRRHIATMTTKRNGPPPSETGLDRTS
jgi:hypothetical protein